MVQNPFRLVVENLHCNHNLGRIVRSNPYSSVSLHMVVSVNFKLIDEKTTSVMQSSNVSLFYWLKVYSNFCLGSLIFNRIHKAISF